MGPTLKCVILGAALVAGGYYVYKKRWIRLPRGLT